MLEALGNLGDFIGGLAVVVTLVYLAVQIRQNTSQLERTAAISKAATYQSLTTLIVEVNTSIAKNREFAELQMRGREALANLDQVDQNRFLILMSSVFRIMENLYQQHAAGFLSDDEYSSWTYLLRTHLSHPGAHEAWHRLAPAFSPPFRKLIESIASEPAA